MLIDTQVHVLDPARFPYPAASKGYVPNAEEAAPADRVRDILAAHAVTHAVAVQASVYGTDNAAILAFADLDPARYRAIVVADPDEAAALCRRRGVAGVRLNLTNFAGQDLETAARVGRIAHGEGAIVQLQAAPDALRRLLDALGDGPVILDHLGRVDLVTPGAAAVVADLARRPETYLKVSAHFRVPGAAEHGAPTAALRDLLAAFGPDRLLWGSDYPFINLDGPPPDYGDCLAFGRAAIDMDAATRAAARLFGFDG